jgi:hypothetical protein
LTAKLLWLTVPVIRNIYSMLPHCVYTLYFLHIQNQLSLFAQNLKMWLSFFANCYGLCTMSWPLSIWPCIPVAYL